MPEEIDWKTFNLDGHDDEILNKWCKYIGGYDVHPVHGRRNDSAIDWWCFNTHKPAFGKGGKSGATWTQIQRFYQNNPEKFMMWLALYKQGHRHGKT